MESQKKNDQNKLHLNSSELGRGSISRRDFIRLMGIFGASAVLTSCAPAVLTAEAPTAAAKIAATTAPTMAPAATQVPTAVAPKVLRAGIAIFEASSFDIASTGSGMVPVVALMYEWLVRYKAGTGEVEPWLAKSWDMSADNTAVTFHLQEGVQWHKDYGEFTADDVKFTIDRIVNDKLPEATTWSNLDHIEVIDKYTVKFVMKSPSPTLFSLSLPFQAGMMISKAAVTALGAKAFNETPVGTGPYELVSFEVGQSINFKAFDKYWGKRALTADQVTWAVPKDVLTAIQAGDLDIAAATMTQLADAKKMTDIESASRLTRYWWISLPCTDPILKDVNVRKAIRAAIDINPILEASGNGMGERGYAMVPPGIIGYWPDAPHYERDVNQAKQFLKDAGHPTGLKVPFLAVSDPADPGVEVMRQQLAEVGIILDVNAVDSSTYWSLAPEGKHMTIISYQTLPDGGYTLSFFASGEFWNTMKWSNKKFDDLYKQTTKEMDSKARAQMLIDMQKLMDEDAAMVYIGYQPQGVVFKKGVVDLGPNQEALLVNGVLDTSRVRIL